VTMSHDYDNGKCTLMCQASKTSLVQSPGENSPALLWPFGIPRVQE